MNLRHLRESVALLAARLRQHKVAVPLPKVLQDLTPQVRVQQQGATCVAPGASACLGPWRRAVPRSGCTAVWMWTLGATLRYQGSSTCCVVCRTVLCCGVMQGPISWEDTGLPQVMFAEPFTPAPAKHSSGAHLLQREFARHSVFGA